MLTMRKRAEPTSPVMTTTQTPTHHGGGLCARLHLTHAAGDLLSWPCGPGPASSRRSQQWGKEAQHCAAWWKEMGQLLGPFRSIPRGLGKSRFRCGHHPSACQRLPWRMRPRCISQRPFLGVSLQHFFFSLTQPCSTNSFQEWAAAFHRQVTQVFFYLGQSPLCVPDGCLAGVDVFL